MSLVETQNLKKYFETMEGTVKAVNDVTLNVEHGETLGVVGESGCGKTTLGRTILKLLEPTEGKIYFNGTDITDYNGKKMRQLRKEMNIVFQEPAASLNPQMTVYDHLNRPLEIHDLVDSEDEKLERMVDILHTMGLKAEHLIRYPHELSGGQQQRVCIARAICVEPQFLILDEPTSALDVSVQSKILKLLDQTKKKFDLSFMFISHDINLVRAISTRMAVMYLGRIVEIGDADEVFNNPRHPYTKALLKTVPQPDPDDEVEVALTGDVPSPINPPEGCSFAPRCQEKAGKICKRKPPELTQENGSRVACHLYE